MTFELSVRGGNADTAGLTLFLIRPVIAGYRGTFARSAGPPEGQIVQRIMFYLSIGTAQPLSPKVSSLRSQLRLRVKKDDVDDVNI